MAARARLSLLATGGTIAMQGGPTGGQVALTAAGLLARATALRELAVVQAVDLPGRPSAAFDWGDLARIVDAVNAQTAADGIIVAHGTDTLEETAFALACAARTEAVVVLTGAMRRFDEPGADGAANLEAAARVALAPDARGSGVLVVMDDEVHAAALVRKAHAFRRHAFTSDPFGPIGWVKEGRPWFALASALRLPRLSFGQGRPRIPLIEAGPAFEPSWIDAIAQDADALVLSLPGGGHVTPSALPQLEALARERPVVFASRTGGGGVLERSYGFPGSERDLIGRGLIPSAWLDARKSRVLLALALSQGADLANVREIFAGLQ